MRGVGGGVIASIIPETKREPRRRKDAKESKKEKMNAETPRRRDAEANMANRASGNTAMSGLLNERIHGIASPCLPRRLCVSAFIFSFVFRLASLRFKSRLFISRTTFDILGQMPNYWTDQSAKSVR
jgi:hypothetical protein